MNFWRGRRDVPRLFIFMAILCVECNGKEEIMAFVTLEEGKKYLRVDSDYEDSLISALITSSEILCCDIARLSEEQWDAVSAEQRDRENVTAPTAELARNRALMRCAILYALGYLYEHREDADHHDLVITLRNLLFSLREGVL